MQHSSPHSPPPKTFNLFSASTIQYLVFAGLAYILAGAPLLEHISQLTTPSSASASTSKSTWDSTSQSSSRGYPDPPAYLENIVFPDENLTCGEHNYKGVYVLNREPLVVYIEGFLSEEESRHVVEESRPHLTPSPTYSGHTKSHDPKTRLSNRALTPRTPTVQCIEARARSLQGYRPYVFTEALWTQAYPVGGHYTYHYDWGMARKGQGRVSSFMVYVGNSHEKGGKKGKKQELEGGGTHFPRLRHPYEGQEKQEGEWCRLIECNTPSSSPSSLSNKDSDSEVDLSSGVIFKPLRNNAIYWENMRADGSGYDESWHAGLPVTKGEKVGLNIWSWWQEGYVHPKRRPASEAEEFKEEKGKRVEKEEAKTIGKEVGPASESQREDSE